MAISDWPIAERPRERLLAKGAKLLTDAELVAVLLRTGVRGKNAIELARDLLSEFGGVTKMLSAGAELGRVKGLGPAKSAQFAAALELACRSHEVFVCIWLDAQHRVISFEEPFRGTLTQTSVYPREIVKAALAANAAAVIFAHNHPSGAAQPSQADELLTRSLKEALALVDVKVLDHFIVAGNQALSFAERGLL